MKRSIQTVSCRVLLIPSRTRSLNLVCRRFQSLRAASSLSSTSSPFHIQDSPPPPVALNNPTIKAQASKPLPFKQSQLRRMKYPSPAVEEALKSAKLSSLHARLCLPIFYSLHTLARCLVDPTADPDERFNNESLSLLGSDLAAFHIAEYLICKYPRIPMEILFTAQKAYIGPESMKTVAQEWGVEAVVEPGGETDPGYLQFRRQLRSEPTYELTEEERRKEQEILSLDPEYVATQTLRDRENRVAKPTRIMRWDIFGEDPAVKAPVQNEDGQFITTLEAASANFVNAVIGGLALHAGKTAAKTFVHHHFISRKLDVSKLFSYAYPMKDLTNLCRREGWESPIARIISETGRKSAHPVFVIGVFSGRDKLGEGVGGSIVEARLRAAVSALKSWYLYSPLEMTLPSDFESKSKDQDMWKPNLIDPGEIYR